MRSMVEGCERSEHEAVGPLHRTSCGPHWQVDRAPGTILGCRGQSNLPIRSQED